jgi:hypothetical protein
MQKLKGVQWDNMRLFTHNMKHNMKHNISSNGNKSISNIISVAMHSPHMNIASSVSLWSI